MSRLAILTVVALAACARPLLGPDDGSDSDTGDDSSTGDAPAPTPDDAGESGPIDDCHPSYSPCLPVVDDLDCPDVVALGLAPVELHGEDTYGLDADGDGIGCEP